MDAVTVAIGHDHFVIDHPFQVAAQRSLDGESEDKIFSSCRAADGGKRHRFIAFVEKLKQIALHLSGTAALKDSTLPVAQSSHRNLSYGASCLAGRATIDLAQSAHKAVGTVAKASDLTVPRPLFERADELIE